MSFDKHATFNNLSYLPPDQVAYGNGDESGQRFAIYYPTGSPDDYRINRGHPGRWAVAVRVVLDDYVLSAPDFADDSATPITSAHGILWQCLVEGIAVVVAQVTSASTTNANGDVPTGKGLFHAAGGVDGYYESRDRPSAKKDVIHLVQHLRYHAETYGIEPSALALIGGRAGGYASSDVSAWVGLAPNRAGELGTGGQHDESTVPNCCVFAAPPVWFWDHFVGDDADIAVHFPGAETGGAGVDDLVAADLASAPARYKRAAELRGYIGNLGVRSIPSTLLYAVGAPQDLILGEPYTEDIRAADNEGSAWAALVLRQAMPRGLVRLVLADAARTAITDSAAVPAAWFDDPQWKNYENTGGSESRLGIEFLLAHIHDRQWDSELPWQGVFRRAQVAVAGRIAAPANAARSGVVLTCTGPAGLRYGFSTGSQLLQPGESVAIPSQGRVWVGAQDVPPYVSAYVLEERP